MLYYYISTVGEQMHTYNYGDFLEGDFIKNNNSGVLFKVYAVEEERVTLVNGCYSIDKGYGPARDGIYRYADIYDNPIHNKDYSRMEVRSRKWLKKIKDGDNHNFTRIARKDIAKDYGIQKKRGTCCGYMLDWADFDNNPECFYPKIKPDKVRYYLQKAFLDKSERISEWFSRSPTSYNRSDVWRYKSNLSDLEEIIKFINLMTKDMMKIEKTIKPTPEKL